MNEVVNPPVWPADKVERRSTASLVAYAKNARTHSEEQVGQIAASIREFGFAVPVLIDDGGMIIAGHGRVLAAARLGIDEVPVMVARGWSEAQIKAYRLADNQLALNAGWDNALLRIELADLAEMSFDMQLTGFSESELAGLMGSNLGLTDPDEAPEPPAEPVTKLGDVWLLGRHRLVCGDATDAGVVAAALAGVKPHLMVTDPPYGVSLDPSWRDASGANTKGKSGKGGEHYMSSGKTDTQARWDEAWKLSPADVFYVFCAAGPLLIEAAQGLDDSGFELRQILVWDKGVLTLTRTHYWYTHEHILYGVRKGKSTHWIGANGQSSVWSVPSPKHIMSGSKEKREPHPAQRPVDVMKRPIENNSSPGQAVYDPFCGSGTTIIAAEMTGRTCHAIEISPAYTDVSMLRWQAFTGETAQKETI